MIGGLVNATMGLTPKQVVKGLFWLFWSMFLLLCFIVIVGVLNEQATSQESADILQKGLVIFSIPPALTFLYFVKVIGKKLFSK